MEQGDLTDTIVTNLPHANRSNIYCILKAFDINSIQKKQKVKRV